MTAVVLRGDARALPLADESVDLIVTSPPYWSLRSYTDDGEHYDGQIGDEPTPDEYLANLWDCTREWMRVLKPSGSMWVNLGDVYGRGSRSREARAQSLHDRRERGVDRGLLGDDLPAGTQPKSLVGLPWRYALGCVDDLGLILRRDQIWHKTNPLPESITDRCATTHEYWFHLVKQQQYFAALDAIREPHAEPDGRPGYGRVRPTLSGGTRGGNTGVLDHAATRDMGQHPLGRLPGSVWSIASQPLVVPERLAVEHYAAFPPALVRRIILGWSPSGICTKCGEGRRPCMERTAVEGHGWAQSQQFDRIGQEVPNRRVPSALGYRAAERAARITGYACACPEPIAPTRPSVVLDPFGGTGTTAMVADVLGRHGISIDASHDYGRIARWRTADPRERARALGVKPPPAVSDEQLGFDLEAS